MNVPTTLGNLPLTGVECTCVLRYIQRDRRSLFKDRLALEERIRGGEDKDGRLYAALRAVEADITVLDGVIGRLWGLCPPPHPTGPDPPLPSENSA